MIFRNNLDYEYALFDRNYSSSQGLYQKMVEAFEYVYFFIEKRETTLFSHVQYPEEYLNSLTKLGLILPRFLDRCSHYENWWGDLLDLALERKLNSKITSTSMAMEFNWCHPHTKIIESFEQMVDNLHLSSHGEFLIKSPYFMSGRGLHWVNKSHEKHLIQLKQWFDRFKDYGPFIMEPKLKIIVEFGIYYQADHSGLIGLPLVHQNLVDGIGQYKGGLVFQNMDSQLEYLAGKYGQRARELFLDVLKSSEKVAEKYRQMGANRGFGIDTFLYEEDGELRSYVLGEVNYRKTMGLMVHALKNFLPKNGVGVWMLFSKKKVNKWPLPEGLLPHDLRFSLGQSRGVIMTSPPQCKFPTFFLLAPSVEELEDVQGAFLDKLAIK